MALMGTRILARRANLVFIKRKVFSRTAIELFQSSLQPDMEVGTPAHTYRITKMICLALIFVEFFKPFDSSYVVNLLHLHVCEHIYSLSYLDVHIISTRVISVNIRVTLQPHFRSSLLYLLLIRVTLNPKNFVKFFVR